ncbi:uncharacterized protein Bfra_002807 [Botrytis fragariae]|uniref:Uncharacterized protein n=1 Tax=Botrytis fragariae TaxID=1964551 RepID=A0A8H6AZD4_9HELO|nr:uncharacterized protein Bfra_002807 [Botrytis fragariae]KAF5876403.1 hypothetical protein Bfra_002807 [Botrytis fragariae]
MASPFLDLDYPRWNNPVLDQKYSRWNKLFDTMDFDDDESLGRILQAAGAAERFHPFNLKLIDGTDLNEFEMLTVRDLSYEDKVFTLGKATKLCADMLKITKLSPVRRPDMYLQIRRKFCRLAPYLENLDEDEAEAELDRWARWGHHERQVVTRLGIRQSAQGQYDDTASPESMNANVENSGEVTSVRNAAEAEIFEAAKALISMSSQESADGLVITPVPTLQRPISKKRKREESYAGDLPISRGRFVGVELKQKEDMPEKPKHNTFANNSTYWLLDEIDTLCEILNGYTTESFTGTRPMSDILKSVTEEFNHRCAGRLQEKGALRKDGKDKLNDDRYAPKRSIESIQNICRYDYRLERILAEYKNLKKGMNIEVDEESIQVEDYEGDQSLPRMFKWKGIRYIDNNDRAEAEPHKPDKSKTIIQYISLITEPKQDIPEHFKLDRVLFEYKPKMKWNSRNAVTALNQWRQIMLHRTSGAPLEGKKTGLGFNCAWSSEEQYKLGNIMIKRLDETSLRTKTYSKVDFSSVTKEFNDTLGVYRNKKQIKKFVNGKDVRRLKDDYMREQNERKREMEDTNATAAFALSAKKSRISSFDDDQ